MARPREFDYDEALDAAMQLFWLKGYEATSMADLTAAMGLKKGSLYKAYGNKHELFVLAIKRYLGRILGDIQAMVEGAPTVKEGIRRYLTSCSFGFYQQEGVPRGCFAVNTVTELAPHDEEVAEVLTLHFKREVDVLTGVIREAQESGTIASLNAPEALAELVTVVAVGLLVGSKGPLRSIDDARLTEFVLAHFD